MKKYSVSFIGRLKHAIGVRYEIKDIVEAPENATDSEIALKLYDKYEHISQLRINGKLAKQ